jgi:hypothetical protein
MKSLRGKIESLKFLMTQAVSNQCPVSQSHGYKICYSEIWGILKELKWENSNPHKCLESFELYCSKNFNSDLEKTVYIEGLYADILLEIDYLQRRANPSKHWKQTHDLLKDELEPVDRQWQKAKDFIYAANPDYENAIKEAINSIESCLKILLNEPIKTLGYLIKSDKIDADITKLVSQAYGIASNKNGIRHGGTSIENLSKDEAEFFLDFCAIAIIYIIAKLKK